MHFCGGEATGENPAGAGPGGGQGRAAQRGSAGRRPLSRCPSCKAVSVTLNREGGVLMRMVTLHETICRLVWIHVLLPLVTCMTQYKVPDNAVLRFLIYKMEIKTTHRTGLGRRFGKLTCVKCHGPTGTFSPILSLGSCDKNALKTVPWEVGNVGLSLNLATLASPGPGRVPELSGACPSLSRGDQPPRIVGTSLPQPGRLPP